MKHHSVHPTIQFICILLCICIYVFCIGLCLHSMLKQKRDRLLGEQAVYTLYQFSDANELNNNMASLESITTKAVFSQLTIDNSERTLNTYLKFKNTTTSVSIIRSTSQYVLYHVNNESIDPDRVFVFFFNVNSKGRISYVREMEGIDFIENDH